MFDVLFGCLVAWLFDWLVGLLFFCWIGWMFVSSTGVCWFVIISGVLVGWFAGGLVG